VLPGRWAAAAGGGDLDDEGAAMKIRFLPRWPPRWTSASGGSHPGERAGVLQSVEWRVDLQRERNLVIVLMYNGRKFDVQDGIGHRVTIAARRLERMVDRGAAQEVGRP
jgi:hypothetical protein